MSRQMASLGSRWYVITAVGGLTLGVSAAVLDVELWKAILLWLGGNVVGAALASDAREAAPTR